MNKPRTLAEKVWDDHLVVKGEDGTPDLIYIDLHLVHEVTSPQAFDGLRQAGRPVRRLDLTIATEDHNTPTLAIDKPIADETSRVQIQTLRNNAEEFGVRLHSLGDVEQGIVHVVGPQLGLTMPGITVVCGDSHTSTHGAFGAMAFGIGTSEVEHVLATQTLPLKPFKTMAINVEGALKPGVSAKDIILAVIAKIGANGGQGYVLEFRGSAIRALSMEGRMTICNMAIEAGARAGMVAPDQTTFDYLEGRPHAPQGADWDAAVEYWKTLPTDEGAIFDAGVNLDANTLEPFVTWGTNPGQGIRSVMLFRHLQISLTRTSAQLLNVHSNTWTSSLVPSSRMFLLTPSLWVRAPTAALKTFAPSLKSSRARRRRTAFASWSCPVLLVFVSKLKLKAWTRSLKSSVLNGASRVVLCVWV